jgi:hypothetical protein
MNHKMNLRSKATIRQEDLTFVITVAISSMWEKGFLEF